MSSRYKPIKPRQPEPTLFERAKTFFGMGPSPKKESVDNKVPTPEPQGMVPDWMQHLAATGVRVAGPWAGSVIGGMVGAGGGAVAGAPAAGVGAIPAGIAGGIAGSSIGGALGGGLSEALAEKIEPRSKGINLKRVGVSAALGGVPGAWAVRAGKPIASAAVGAGLGYAGTAGYKMADGTPIEEAADPRTWSKGELLLGPGLGAGLGGLLGKVSAPHGPAGSKTVGEVTPIGKNDSGTMSWRVKPDKAPFAAKLGSEEQAMVQQNATAAAKPAGSRIARDAAKVAKSSVKSAAVDTRPTTTAPKAPIKAPNSVFTNSQPGSRFAVADPSFASAEDLALRSGSPVEASEATQRALAKAGNPRMGAAQTTTARAAGKAAVRQEATADLQQLKNETRGANVAEKSQTQKWTQEAKNLNKREAKLAEMEAEQAAQNKIDALLNNENVVAGKPTVVETAQVNIPGGKQTLRQSFYEKPPETEGGEGGMGSGPSVKPPSQHPRDVIAQTMYPTEEAAIKAALGSGAADVQRVGRGKYRVVYKDAPPSAQVPLTELPEGSVAPKRTLADAVAETDKPKGVAPAKMEEPVKASPQMAPSLERDAIAAKRYTNKVEAAAIAKATGGRVVQYGPKKYRVVFEEEAPLTSEGMAPATQKAAIAEFQAKSAPPPPTKAATNGPETGPIQSYNGIDPKTSRLTPEELKRYIEIRPGQGTKLTPAEMAEYKVLHAKMNGEVIQPGLGKLEKVEGSDKSAPGAAEKMAAMSDEEFRAATSRSPKPLGKAAQDVVERRITPGKAPAGMTERRSEDLLKKFGGTKATPEPRDANVMNAGAPMTVKEFATALSKEGEKPLVELPFNLKGEPAVPTPKPKVPVEGDLLASANKLEDLTSQLGVPTKPPFYADKPNPFSQKLNDAMADIEAGKAKVRAATTPQQVKDALKAKPAAQTNPAKLYKSQFEAAGSGYGDIKAAKAAGEKVPEAGRSAGAAAAQRITKEEMAKGGPTLQDIATLPPESQTKILTDLVNRFKKGNESGAVSNDLLIRAGLGTAGALAGAAANPDDPLTGALIGASTGAFLPSIARALQNRAQSGNMAPRLLPEAAKKISDGATTFFNMLPEWQRFALLSHPTNLPLNVWVGPWGAGIMAGIEHTLIGDPRGWETLKKFLNPSRFPKEWGKARAEATTLIASSEERTEGALGQVGPEAFKWLTRQPGEAMTAGDVAARNLLQEAGFTAEEARAITLTSEPFTAYGQGVSKFKKGAMTKGGKRSWLVNMMLPFYRTGVNQLEQSAQRFPGLGFLVQNKWKDMPDPIRHQVVQQFVGGGVGTVSYILGYMTPPDEIAKPFGSKFTLKFINNFFGQYGTIASTMFVMGQAAGQGKSKLGALQQSVTRGDLLPLPSVEPATNALGVVREISEGEPVKPSHFRTLMPGIVNKDVPLSAQWVANGGNQTPTNRRPTQSRPPRSRYRPIKQRQ